MKIIENREQQWVEKSQVRGWVDISRWPISKTADPPGPLGATAASGRAEKAKPKRNQRENKKKQNIKIRARTFEKEGACALDRGPQRGAKIERRWGRWSY